MTVVDGFRATVSRRTPAPSSVIPAQRWTPVPVVEPYVARRPAALVPVGWLGVGTLVIGFVQPLALIGAAVALVVALLLCVQWSRAARRAARRNAERLRMPGRHTRPAGAGRHAAAGSD